MESNRLLLIKNKKVLDFTFEDKRDFCQCQGGCVDFCALYVADLVVADTGLNCELILGNTVIQPQLSKPFTQPTPKPILLFWGHSSKLPLSAVPDRPIYRVIFYLAPRKLLLPPSHYIAGCEWAFFNPKTNQ